MGLCRAEPLAEIRKGNLKRSSGNPRTSRLPHSYRGRQLRLTYQREFRKPIVKVFSQGLTGVGTDFVLTSAFVSGLIRLTFQAVASTECP